MSRFATMKSEDARLDSLADPSQYGDLDENDPNSVARFMKKMGQEMGRTSATISTRRWRRPGTRETGGDDDGGLGGRRRERLTAACRR